MLFPALVMIAAQVTPTTELPKGQPIAPPPPAISGTLPDGRALPDDVAAFIDHQDRCDLSLEAAQAGRTGEAGACEGLVAERADLATRYAGDAAVRALLADYAGKEGAR